MEKRLFSHVSEPFHTFPIQHDCIQIISICTKSLWSDQGKIHSSPRPSLWPQARLHNGGRDQHKFQTDTTHITQQSTLVTVDKIIILRLQKTDHNPTRAYQPKETYLAPSGFGKGYPKSKVSAPQDHSYISACVHACDWLRMRVIGWGERDTRN